jgi:MYXO-CTERM domain-containing protein
MDRLGVQGMDTSDTQLLRGETLAEEPMLLSMRSIKECFPRALCAATASFLAWLPVGPASAHIDLDQAGTHDSRYGEADIKNAPCGRAGAARGANVYTYKPGATITISLREYVPHPGYFRIAFDQDGDDDFADPATLSGLGGNCAGDPKCGAGMDDFCNNDSVLIDNLDQHTASFTSGAKTYTWTVTLPNVECQNCRLQIIQVMADLNFHPQPYPAADIYYQCIDLVLSNAATEESDTPMPNSRMNCKEGEPQAGAGGTGAGGTGAGDAGTGGAAGTMMAGSGGSGAAAGDPGPMAGTTGGTAGAAGVGGMMSAGVGGVSASGMGAAALGGASGTAGVSGEMMAGAAAPSGGGNNNSSSSGCSAAGTGRDHGLPMLATMLLALAAVHRRRRVR